MKFKEWLQLREVGTSTADVAAYARPIMTSMDRRYPDPIVFGKKDPFFDKNKKGIRGTSKQHLP